MYRAGYKSRRESFHCLLPAAPAPGIREICPLSRTVPSALVIVLLPPKGQCGTGDFHPSPLHGPWAVQNHPRPSPPQMCLLAPVQS